MERVNLYKTYISLIKNSERTKIFRNCFVYNKRVKDSTENGRLSCAFYVSSILYLTGLISKVHLSVKGAVRDMKRNKWFEIKRPKKGSVILWEKKEGHYHLGFYIGKNKAISNSSTLGKVKIHHLTFKNKRKIQSIFWNKKLSRKRATINVIKGD